MIRLGVHKKLIYLHANLDALKVQKLSREDDITDDNGAVLMLKCHLGTSMEPNEMRRSG